MKLGRHNSHDYILHIPLTRFHMDNVTHALAGALMAAATCEIVARRHGEPSNGFRRAAYALGVVMAELPDSDLAYSGRIMEPEKLGYLLHHRGHTHTVVFVIVSALVGWAIALGMRRELRDRNAAQSLLVLSLTASVSHIVLDWTNSYGVHPFWPIDDRWFYGDAVFIVEPWFWIVALPPLFFVARSVVTRALCVMLLLVIVVAAWRVSMVEATVAGVLTVSAVLWAALVRMATPSRRVTMGLVAWLGMEGMFFTSSVAGRTIVRQAVGASYRDAALTPAPGNPLCLAALVVREERGVYYATNATVAPFASLHDVRSCSGGGNRTTGISAVTHADRAIAWGADWSAPVSELRALAANCEVAAALRFMRVPAWHVATDGSVLLYDRRFSDAEGGGFASIVARDGAPCPPHVPDWEWPRSDVLGNAP